MSNFLFINYSVNSLNPLRQLIVLKEDFKSFIFKPRKYFLRKILLCFLKKNGA